MYLKLASYATFVYVYLNTLRSICWV